jgi:hypothetical protein
LITTAYKGNEEQSKSWGNADLVQWVARRRYRHDMAFCTDVNAGGMGMDSGQWRLTRRLGKVK